MYYLYINRHVMLPKEIAKLVPKTHLMSEAEWRGLGVQQSVGWIHYMRHEPGNLLQSLFLNSVFILYKQSSLQLCLDKQDGLHTCTICSFKGTCSPLTWNYSE